MVVPLRDCMEERVSLFLHSGARAMSSLEIQRKNVSKILKLQVATLACEKRSTPLEEKVNTPLHKRSTLINGNLKREIQEKKRSWSGFGKGVTCRLKQLGKKLF